jgi:Ca2+-binding RTX toxin-like protein
MKIRFMFQLVTFGLLALILISVITAIAAANTVPSTRLDNQAKSVTSNDLKPASCASLDLRNIVSGSGAITGTSYSDLILGSAGDDTIDGLDGDDCILGGGGTDTINGGNQNDICNGGGDASDTFATCETIVP